MSTFKEEKVCFHKQYCQRRGRRYYHKKLFKTLCCNFRFGILPLSCYQELFLILNTQGQKKWSLIPLKLPLKHQRKKKNNASARTLFVYMPVMLASICLWWVAKFKKPKEKWKEIKNILKPFHLLACIW